MARHPSPTMFMHRPVLTPERKLWRAVLAQACADADGNANAPQESGADAAEATRTIARRFLRGAGPCEAQFLAMVCDYAGVSYDRVVLWARKRYPAESAEPESVEEIIADQILADEITGDEIIAVELSDAPPN